MTKPLRTFSGRPASQHPDELRPLIALMVERGVRRYLEIGARHGDTFHEVMTSLEPGAVGVAVDLPGGAWGTAVSLKALHRAVADVKARGRAAAAVIGDSTSPEVWSRVGLTMTDLAVSGFDAVLIDGDHRYEGVLKDYQIWGGVAPMIIFHDIAGEGVRQKDSGLPVEVPRLWREIKEANAHRWTFREFVGEGSAMGIGVILKD